MKNERLKSSRVVSVLASCVAAVTSNLDFLGPGILTKLAAKLVPMRDCASARGMSTFFYFFLGHWLSLPFRELIEQSTLQTPGSRLWNTIPTPPRTR